VSVCVAEGAYHIVAREVRGFITGVGDQFCLQNFSLKVDAAQLSGDGNSAAGVVYAYREGENHSEVADEGSLALQGDIDDNDGNWFENSLQ
jgi:hypothetical protein